MSKLPFLGIVGFASIAAFVVSIVCEMAATKVGAFELVDAASRMPAQFVVGVIVGTFVLLAERNLD